jgi:ribosomal subunit interface protein
MMMVPPEIVFEGMDSSDAVRARVEKEVAKLERFHERITSCRVVVEAPSHAKQKGGLYRVRVRMLTPDGGEIKAERHSDQNHAHEDVYVAIRDAFAAARRQLQDRSRRRRGDVKAHEAPPQGTVSKVFRDKGYGFIRTAAGDEIYFHRNSVLNDGFDRLQLGEIVRYAEEMGEKGPQASTVHPLGKPQTD